MFSVIFLSALLGCTATTESTEVGVRTQLVGPSRGVEPEYYPPGGTYFFLRALSDFKTFDVGVQNLAMLRENGDALRFKTVDGNDVWVDATIAWSLDPKQAPYMMQFVGGSTQEVQDKIVRPVARSMVRDVLNRLTSEEYYSSDRRFIAAEEARTQLAAVLGNEGILINQVLLGEHKFNEEYEQLIRDKKVAEQEAERLVSETESEVESKRRELEQLSGEIDQSKALTTGDSEKRKRDADAIRYENEQDAVAIKLEAKAKSDGLRERAAAMSGAGGKSMVKLKVADALKGKKIIFIPAGGGMDLRATDMNAFLGAYGVGKMVPTP